MDSRKRVLQRSPSPVGRTAFATPDLERAKRHYQALAARYDASCTRIEALRIEAIDRLNLRRGDTVVDVGCGTGLSFPYLIERIGRSGQLIGIEPSAAMMARARRRIACAGWHNVILIEAPAQLAVLPAPCDALLFCFTHDVVRSPQTLSSLFAQLRTNARVVAAGAKLAPWWLAPMNLWLLARCRRYVTTFEGFATPWSHLAALVAGLRIESRHWGTAWVASGHVPPLPLPETAS